MRWIGSIPELADEDPSRAFSLEEVHGQTDLFGHRSALFFTPTENIPPAWVGAGPLDVTLRLVTPDWTDLDQIRAYASPRLWVDQLQRATGKIRWQPVDPARVAFSRFDTMAIRDDHLVAGMKALRDALKVSTYGRRDGRRLHYFGAIVDDDDRHLVAHYDQHMVERLADSQVQVRVTRPT